MKLKVQFFDGAQHSDAVTCIAWNNNEEVYSSGDDHELIKWNFVLNESAAVAKLPDDLFPTSLHWLPKNNSTKKSASELLLAASADGKFHFLNKNGRFDRSVDAHQGAVLVALWSRDGAGLLTGGEDGQVKIWSRSGMLRSTVLTGDVPVYTAAWAPDSNQVLVAQDRSLLLKPLAPNSKPNRWRAHDGLILKVSWNQSNNLIVSGGEDCRYKVWDVLGHALYSSAPHEHPVTSIAWAPAGDVFAVGCFNTLRLCDRVGWSHSLEKVTTGTIYDLAWSPDGTQLAGACANGNVIFAHVLHRREEWKNYVVTLMTGESLTVHNVLDDTEEKLELGDRVAKMALGFGHLVVTTSTQCYIYSTTNWNTPVIMQLKDGPASLISLTYKHLLLIERSNLNIYSFDGRPQWSPKIPALQLDLIDDSCVSLADDTLAAIDQNDNKVIHLIELTSGRPAVAQQPIQHNQGVVQVALSQTGAVNDRILAFLDQNRDVYIAMVRSRDHRRPLKIGAMVSGIAWGTDTAQLAAIRESTLTVWCCPLSLHFDSHLLRRTTFSRDLSEVGKGVKLISFTGNLIALRRCDGSLMNQSVPAYIASLLDMTADERWEDALRLSRFIKDDLLWACLACLSAIKRELSTAEEAFAAISELDKVEYIKYIKSLPLQPARSAHLALLAGNAVDAEGILLSNGLVFRTIMLLIDTHQWLRALDLAIKHRTHVDTVLYKRKLYLDSFGKVETNEKFLQYFKEVDVEEQVVNDKIVSALARERESV